MDINKLINRSYQAIKNRGLINDNTTLEDFFYKIEEEFNEMLEAFNDNELVEEAIDLATVCFNLVKFIGKEPVKEFEKVVIKNEERAKMRRNDN